MPFLRLTRDRRGFENTFLLHADHPGAKERLLYWYRTAPGIALGRPALDEDAIRTIEENHPDIEFDWPAILALSEVMTPEEEAEARPHPPQPQRRERKQKYRERREEERPAVASSSPEVEEPANVHSPEPEPVARPGLVDDLAGREVARALRARYAEITSRIDQMDGDKGGWRARAAAINPDAWLTPEAVLHGVSNAAALYEKLKTELEAHSSRE